MPKPRKKRRGSARRTSKKTDEDAPVDEKGRPRGVFVLPLEGGVGQTFRVG